MRFTNYSIFNKIKSKQPWFNKQSYNRRVEDCCSSCLSSFDFLLGREQHVQGLEILSAINRDSYISFMPRSFETISHVRSAHSLAQ